MKIRLEDFSYNLKPGYTKNKKLVNSVTLGRERTPHRNSPYSQPYYVIFFFCRLLTFKNTLIY